MNKETLQIKIKEETEILNKYNSDIKHLCQKYSLPIDQVFDSTVTIPSEVIRVVYFYNRQKDKIDKLQQSLDRINKKEQVFQILELYHNTPEGQIEDCDTILADYMESVSFEETGLGEEILEI